MAKATAYCNCRECGAEFTKSTIRANRREANDWERWAVSNYDKCPSCWGKAQREKEESEPIVLHMALEPYSQSLILYFTGNTKPHKEAIKASGYRFDFLPSKGWLGLLETRQPPKGWYKKISGADFKSDLSSIAAREDALINQIGASLKTDISQADYVVYSQLAQEKAAKDENIKAEMAKLKKPHVPEVLAGTKWNQKVYGRSGNYSVYPDGKKTEITDEQASEIEVYIQEKAAYLKVVEEIKGGK